MGHDSSELGGSRVGAEADRDQTVWHRRTGIDGLQQVHKAWIDGTKIDDEWAEAKVTVQAT